MGIAIGVQAVNSKFRPPNYQMSKAKHQPSGDTPEPAARKLRLDGEKTEQEDEMMLDKNYIMNKIEELQRQSSTAKVQAAFPTCTTRRHPKRESKEGDSLWRLVYVHHLY